MSSITFSRLRDSGDWSLRGTKQEPHDHPPGEGEMVTVTKKGGDTQEVAVGRVVAQGDDWWLATIQGSEQGKPDHHRVGESERQIAALIQQVKELRVEMKAIKHNIMEMQLEMNEQATPDHDANANDQQDGEPREANPWA